MSIETGTVVVYRKDGTEALRQPGVEVSKFPAVANAAQQFCGASLGKIEYTDLLTAKRAPRGKAPEAPKQTAMAAAEAPKAAAKSGK